MQNMVSQLRKKNHITQGNLAEALGVSRQTVSAIENLHYAPTLKLAFKISVFFNLPIEQIFIFTHKSTKKN